MVIPVVGECDDSFLNDCRAMQVETADVFAAHREALDSRGGPAPPVEGAVGAGTGMSCLGFKGGIGTSSRVTQAGHTVAVLLLTNFGERKRLTVAGVPVGALLPPADDAPPTPAGSCIGVVVTDAPVDRRRLCAPGAPHRSGTGPDRLDGPPRQRRDLPGRVDHVSLRPRRRQRRTGRS